MLDYNDHEERLVHIEHVLKLLAIQTANLYELAAAAADLNMRRRTSLRQPSRKSEADDSGSSL